MRGDREEVVASADGVLQRRRALLHTNFQLLIQLTKRLLCHFALGDFALQRLIRSCQGPRFAEKLHEPGNLRPQDVRVHGFCEVIDCTGTITTEHIPIVEHMSGQEENRDVLRALPLLDQARQLDASHARHFDIEHDGRELLVKQRHQRLIG